MVIKNPLFFLRLQDIRASFILKADYDLGFFNEQHWFELQSHEQLVKHED